MDEFREWLSDNLRYFMLGGAILIIIAVLFFGIRACAGKKSGGTKSNNTTTEAGSDSDTKEEGGEAETSSNPLQTAGEDVTGLINKYYEALGNKDVDALQAIEVNFDAEDGEKIVNSADYIESYKVKDVYTKNGLSEGSYVVYASFEYKCRDIDTPVPALSQLYVITDENGDLKIDAAASSDSAITNYVNQLKNDDDVTALTKQVRDAYEQAQKDDEDLAAFLNEIGTDEQSETQTEESSGNTMTVTATSVNIRSEPSTNGYILGAYPAGTKVEPKNNIDGWIEIDYNGQTGYIYSDYLE